MLAMARFARRGLTRSFSSGSTVGFIGLGSMGSNMAANLQKKGHSLIVYDAFPTAPGFKMLEELGAKRAGSLAEVAESADTILTMVTACDHVREVYASADGIFANAKGSKLIMDCSTIKPSTSLEMIGAASKAGHTFVDTPVGGGVPAASAGTLTFMVGAGEESEEWKRVKPFLDCMGANIVPCGAPGKGGAAKLCNNLILGISMVGVSEGYRLAAELGVDMHLFDTVVNGSSGRCWSSDTYNPVPELKDRYPNAPASREYSPPSFMLELMLKDLKFAIETGESVGHTMPLLKEATALYQEAHDKGHHKKCFSSIYHFGQH